MDARFVLTDYITAALVSSVYEELPGGTFCGRIPQCVGVIAFGDTRRDCQLELRSTLEDWILVGLRLGHSLPVIGGIDLNQGPIREPVEAV